MHMESSMILYKEKNDKMTKITDNIKSIWIIPFLIVSLLIHTHVKCQQINMNNPSQKEFLSIINRVKSYSAVDFKFSVSMPSLVTQSANGWEIAYFVFIEDSIIQEFCSRPDAIDYVPQLLLMMIADEYSWQVNILLYCITKKNAIELMAYRPNCVYAWTKEQKERDINLWKKMLSE